MGDVYITHIFLKKIFCYYWEEIKMAKTKTSCVPKKSAKNISNLRIKKGVDIIAYSPTQELLNEKLIRDALWECLKNNDPDGVIDVLSAYFEAANKNMLCQKTTIARSTLYHSLKEKNPTLKTLAKLISVSSHSGAQR
jgi:DNA-binding phage protein